jgi:hypothetical protein
MLLIASDLLSSVKKNTYLANKIVKSLDDYSDLLEEYQEKGFLKVEVGKYTGLFVILQDNKAIAEACFGQTELDIKLDTTEKLITFGCLIKGIENLFVQEWIENAVREGFRQLMEITDEVSSEEAEILINENIDMGTQIGSYESSGGYDAAMETIRCFLLQYITDYYVEKNCEKSFGDMDFIHSFA